MIKKKIKKVLKSKGYIIKPFQEIPADEKNRKLIFLHIPKTGGTSLRKLLASQYVSSYNLPAEKTKKISDYLNADLQTIRQADLVNHVFYDNYNFISGHIKVFNELWKLSEDYNYSLVTIFRDPIDRFFSQYFFDRYKTNNHTKIDMDFDELLESKLGMLIGNQYLNFLSGLPVEVSVDEKMSSAKENLQKIHHIGFLENFDDFLNQDLSSFIIDSSKFPEKQKNKNPANKELYEKMKNNALYQAKVAELSKADCELYDFALSLKRK